MTDDGAIVAAGFALRDAGIGSPEVVRRLAALLPPALADVTSDECEALRRAIVRLVAGDDVASKFLSDRTGTTEAAKPETETFKAFVPTIYDAPSVTAVFFVCPRGDFTYPRRDLRDPVPECPTHHIPLERAG